MKRFRGGLVVKAHRLVCHSTLGCGVIKKKKKKKKKKKGGEVYPLVSNMPSPHAGMSDGPIVSDAPASELLFFFYKPPWR